MLVWCLSHGVVEDNDEQERRQRVTLRDSSENVELITVSVGADNFGGSAGVSSLDGFEKLRGDAICLQDLDILQWWIESKAFLKSMKVSTAGRLFFLTSSMIFLESQDLHNCRPLIPEAVLVESELGSMAVLIRLRIR